MMREIKFRAWDKKRKEWYRRLGWERSCFSGCPEVLTYYGFHLFGECTLIEPPTTGDLRYLEITEWTGLKDKNGKEIYEGDILKGLWGEQQDAVRHEIYGQVVFSNGCFEWVTWLKRFKNFDGKYGIKWREQFPNFDEYREVGDIKIIGNIYENPELLEK